MFSDQFAVMIGTKQGSVISSVVFCLYLDGLQVKLSAGKCGAFVVDSFFAVILAYADVIALLALTPHVMRKMSKIL